VRREAAVFVDFDGTLARIVPDPASARPLDGTAVVLADLARRCGLVAVVSGRPAAFLAATIPVPGVILSGLYGMETWDAGQITELAEAAPWRSIVAAVADRATAEAPEGVLVERKGLSVTLHVRTSPEHEGWVRAWAAEVAATSGLVAHPARRSVALRPPGAADKGTVVRTLAAGRPAACFLGDDAGDLPAFAALARLAATGAATVKVAVRSDEVPPELLARADLTVDGPEGAQALLRVLASP
jgi:trehalose 6-phosphate phosphatase